jgi:uncharacterized protein Yka (UPF0111/DUF47 family)
MSNPVPLTIESFVRLARKYAALGESVMNQMDDALAGEFEDLNPNALAEVARFLKSVERYEVEGADTARMDIEQYLNDSVVA